MIGVNGSDPDIRISVTPEPEPAELAAIVAALRARRRRTADVIPAEEPPRPESRWAHAGRREAMMGRVDFGQTDDDDWQEVVW